MKWFGGFWQGQQGLGNSAEKDAGCAFQGMDYFMSLSCVMGTVERKQTLTVLLRGEDLT